MSDTAFNTIEALREDGEFIAMVQELAQVAPLGLEEDGAQTILVSYEGQIYSVRLNDASTENPEIIGIELLGEA